MPSPPDSLRAAYQSRLAEGALHPDPAQLDALERLQDFANALGQYQPPAPTFWSRLTHHKSALPASGFYLYGDVGRGKSMLMDLFFDHVAVAKKRRVHFHQFMLEIHARLHELQDQRLDDIMPALARELARETWLLCFDEFHVSNIVDAMILGRLFEALFAAGVIIVSTSNWAPDDLYLNGLQRARFLPFIELLKQKMIVYRLNGAVDHRYEQIGSIPSTFWPLGEETTRKLQGIFLQLTDEAPLTPLALPVQGRTLNIVHTAKGVGFFNYDELCVTALGAADYLAIAKTLHTVLLDGVPQFQTERRNEAARFITLIDTLYEAKVNFFMGAASALDQLAPAGDYAFAFQRTVSRLVEMQGAEYRHKQHLE